MTYSPLLTPSEAAELSRLSIDRLKRLRLSDALKKGIHWVEIGPRTIRFNAELFDHWLKTRHAPEVHEARIKSYLESLEAPHEN